MSGWPWRTRVAVRLGIAATMLGDDAPIGGLRVTVIEFADRPLKRALSHAMGNETDFSPRAASWSSSPSFPVDGRASPQTSMPRR